MTQLSRTEEEAQMARSEEEALMTPDDNSPATRNVGRLRFQAEIDAEIAKERQAEETRIR